MADDWVFDPTRDSDKLRLVALIRQRAPRLRHVGGALTEAMRETKRDAQIAYLRYARERARPPCSAQEYMKAWIERAEKGDQEPVPEVAPDTKTTGWIPLALERVMKDLMKKTSGGRADRQLMTVAHAETWAVLAWLAIVEDADLASIGSPPMVWYEYEPSGKKSTGVWDGRQFFQTSIWGPKPEQISRARTLVTKAIKRLEAEPMNTTEHMTSKSTRRPHVTRAEYMATGTRRPEVQKMMDAMIGLEIDTEWVARHHSDLRDDADQPGGVPSAFNYADLPPDEADKDKRLAILGARLNALPPEEHTLRRWCQNRDQLAWAIRDWRDSLHRVRELLPSVAALMDDPGIIAAKWWTSRVRSLLNELGGCLPATNWRSLPAIKDDSLTQRLNECLRNLIPFTDDLKALPGLESSVQASLPVASSTTHAFGEVVTKLRESAEHLDTLTRWIPILFPREQDDLLWHIRRDELSKRDSPSDLTLHSWAALEGINGAIRNLGITDSLGRTVPPDSVGVWHNWTNPQFPSGHDSFARQVLAIGVEVHTWHARLSGMSVLGEQGIPQYRIPKETEKWARFCAERIRKLIGGTTESTRGAGGSLNGSTTSPLSMSSAPNVSDNVKSESVKPRKLRPCVVKAGKSLDTAIGARDELTPETGKAPNRAAWEWVRDNFYGKRSCPQYDSWCRYIREYFEDK